MGEKRQALLLVGFSVAVDSLWKTEHTLHLSFGSNKHLALIQHSP